VSLGAELSQSFKFAPRALNQGDDRPAFQDLSTFNKVLDVLNRGTETSASVFNELLFDPTPEPVKAFLDGIQGKGKVQSFTELSKKAGWKPESKEGKAAQFLLGLTMDVGLAPDTYLSFGAGPAAKFLGKGAQLLKAGKSVAQITKDFGKGTGRAAEILEKASKLKNPEVDEVVNKLLKGEKITRAEEAAIGARSVLGMQAPLSHKVYGLEGLVPKVKDANVRFYADAAKVGKWLDTAPVISPTIHGVGKAFNSFYELKKKVPDYMKMRKTRDQAVNNGTAQGFHRAISTYSKVGSAEERKWISELMELPDEDILTKSYFKDVTALVETSPGLWTDLGFTPGQKLGQEDSVKLIDHYLTQYNQWISEFGEHGIMGQKALREKSDELRFFIRMSNPCSEIS